MDISSCEGEEATVIGKFDRLEGDILVLKCMDKEVQVRHAGLDPYKAGIVRVSGVVEDGILIESSIHPIGNDLDLEAYRRFVAVASKFPSLF